MFGIPIQGSLVALYLLSGLFIASVLGLGIFISTLAKTQMQATQMSMFILLPFVFLSGYVFPIGGMPQVFQWLTYVIPAKYFLEIVRGIVLRGASAAELWQPIAWLVLLHGDHHRPRDRAIQEDRGVIGDCRQGGRVTPEEFRVIGHQIVEWVADYHARIAERPVMPLTEPGAVRAALPSSPPATPDGFDAILADVDRLIAPALMHWQHPQFFGFFPSNAACRRSSATI